MNDALVGDIRMIDIKKPTEESASDFSRETILRRISACTGRPGATRGLPTRYPSRWNRADRRGRVLVGGLA